MKSLFAVLLFIAFSSAHAGQIHVNCTSIQKTFGSVIIDGDLNLSAIPGAPETLETVAGSLTTTFDGVSAPVPTTGDYNSDKENESADLSMAIPGTGTFRLSIETNPITQASLTLKAQHASMSCKVTPVTLKAN